MNALRSYPAHTCVPMSQIIHTSSILLLLCSSNTPQNNTNMASSLFSFDLNLSSSPLYLSLGYSAVFSCNYLYSIGAWLMLSSSVATYNSAMKLSKLAYWRLKWAPGVPLWPPCTVVADRHFCLQCHDLQAYHFTHYYVLSYCRVICTCFNS